MLLSLWVSLLAPLVHARNTSESRMESFIVGGYNAAIENYPHSVILKVKCVENNGDAVRWICGASVLNQRLLLTAAHCLFGCTDSSFIGIHMGDEHRNKGQIYSSYSFLIHENYNPSTSGYDISLIKVDGELTLGKKVRRVALMRKPPYNELAKVAGWGLIDETLQKQTNRLMYINQKVRDRNDCLKILGRLPLGTFCASADSAADYASKGDSGSALLVRGYIQIGIVSLKIPNKSKNVVVYTDVGQFYDWITKEAKRVYCEID